MTGLFARNATDKYGFGAGENPMGIVAAIVRNYLSEKLGYEIDYVDYGNGYLSSLDIDPDDIDFHLPYQAREEADLLTGLYLSIFDWAEEFDPWEAEDHSVVFIVAPIANTWNEDFLGVLVRKQVLRKIPLLRKLNDTLPYVKGLVLEADVGYISPDLVRYDKDFTQVDFDAIREKGYAVFSDDVNLPFEDGGKLILCRDSIWAEFKEFATDDLNDAIREALGGGS
jgi:hypothetical protein